MARAPRTSCGRITGPFRYFGSKAAWSHDLHQTRPVAWAPRTLDELAGLLACGGFRVAVAPGSC